MGFTVIFDAFFPLFLVLIPIIVILSFLKSPWLKGILGEMLVHISAKIHLSKDKYHILRNVTLPTADGTTQIDHIIVSEYGVFVIETKNMKGWIFGGARQRTWTQKIFKYSKKFQNPLHQNFKHVETLKALLELNDQQVFSIVVFVGDSKFKTEMPDNVVNGSGMIRYIKSKDQQVILSNDVPMILSKIEAERLASSRETTKAHIEHVKEIVEEKRNGNYCPKCGSPMVEREAKNGANRGQKLIGCSRHPKCRGTAPMPVDDDLLVDDVNEFDFGFTDSWGSRTWRDDEQPAFADKAFR